MSRVWRWCFLGPLAAIVVIGLMPNALLSGAGVPTRNTLGGSVSAVFTPRAVADPVVPTGCADSSCAKGVPSPVAPALTVVAAATLAGVLAVAAASRLTRRQRSVASVLPRGNFIGLFRPPQFS
jgi:hypothetical protein